MTPTTRAGDAPVPDRTAEHLPADSDIDLHVRAQRAEFRRAPWPVLAAIAAGGAVGALARWASGRAFPAAPGAFPWATFGVNVAGCLLLGILMVLVTDVFAGRRLLRPFLGVGVLGGFTTFSAFVVDAEQLINAGAAGTALLYLGTTVVAALGAAATGIGVTRLALRLRRVGTEPAP